jgi:membrane protein insertase Oxa1/YidC/SpoIIIJ
VGGWRMFGFKLTCPECQQPITANTSKCPHCKKKVSQKYLKRYSNAISKFWFVILGCFLLFLIIPFLFYDLLGTIWVGIIILAGLPISFLIAYFVTRATLKKL